jgi:hypothetical protein
MQMFKTAFAAACLLGSVPALADQQGELIWRDPSCYFFVLKIGEGYGLYEFLGGPSPMVGHRFGGALEVFGTRRIDNLTEGKPTMVYSETFETSARAMLRKIPRQCKRKAEFEALVTQQADQPS